MVIYTQNDIDVRRSIIADYISDRGYTLMKRVSRGNKIHCDISKFMMVVDLEEVAACYEPGEIIDDEFVPGNNCITEEDLDHIFETIQCIADICFPNKGQIPQFTDTCFIALESSINHIVLLEDGGGLLRENCL